MVGSDVDMNLYRLDGRYFTPVGKGRVLGFRSVIQLATGEVPFQRLPVWAS